MKNTFSVIFLSSMLIMKSYGQVSTVWVSDQGDDTFINPVLHADYSDPDVVRVGEDFYMTASSFNAVPGLPVLHSKDLVNWELIGHALQRQVPVDHFSVPRHGDGVWAPAIRHHEGMYYIFWGDPDFGIYMVKSKNPIGPWDEPVLVESGKGLIDACPLWDEDGNAYLVHAYAGSRAGIKSILVVKPMSPDGTKVTGTGRLVFDGHPNHPTVEGSKFYKRNGYYYIFAPAGGVSTGWQLVLRSKNPYGPYEERVVMDQGGTDINGPHQGAWISLENNEDWFMHFQDKDAYGRILHLQPLVWKNDWPIIGEFSGDETKGEPVMQTTKPNVGKVYPMATPADSDEFDGIELGLQWQWHANPKATWAFIDSGNSQLTLFTAKPENEARNLWDVPQLLLQKFPAEEFTVTTKLAFYPNEKLENERVGLVVMGMSYANLFLNSSPDGIYLIYGSCEQAINGKPEVMEELRKIKGNDVYLRVKVSKGGLCVFSYSEDGSDFQEVHTAFKAEPGKWIGAKVGLYALRDSQINDSGFARVDFFRFEK